MERFEIVFAADEKYVRHLATSIKSLLVNNPDLLLNIYIINSDIKKKDWNIIAGLDEKGNCEFFDLKISKNQLSGLKINYHFSIANYYRLFIPDLVLSDRALYIDSDTLVVDSLGDLFKLQIDSFLLAAVIDPGFHNHKKLGLSRDSSYFNSGVMLINLKAWRANNIKNKVISFVENNPHLIEFVDQCGLNAIIDGNWLEIDPKYNCQSLFFQNNYKNISMNDIYKIAQQALAKPAIIHFTGSMKPWNMHSKHPYKSSYWQYRNMTPYKSFFSDDFSLVNLLKSFMPNPIKKIIKKLYAFNLSQGV